MLLATTVPLIAFQEHNHLGSKSSKPSVAHYMAVSSCGCISGGQ